MLLLQAENEIMNYLRKHPGCRFIDIVRGTGKSRGIVHRCLEELSKKGELATREVRKRVLRYYPR
jgi:uncharacterized membrane protein